MIQREGVWGDYRVARLFKKIYILSELWQLIKVLFGAGDKSGGAGRVFTAAGPLTRPPGPASPSASAPPSWKRRHETTAGTCGWLRAKTHKRQEHEQNWRSLGSGPCLLSCGLTGRSGSRVQVGQAAPQGFSPLHQRRGPERTERGQTSGLWRRLHQSLKRNSAQLRQGFYTCRYEHK